MSIYTILIAEDDLLLAKVLKKHFEDNNYRVYTADNGSTALKLYTIHRPQIILLDIDLPEKNGWEVLEAIRKIDSYTPLFMITNHYLEEKDALITYELGATLFLRKPISIKEIFALIHNQLKSIYSLPEIISFKNLQLNMTSYILHSEKERYFLKERAAKTLALLIKNANQLVTYNEMQNLIWSRYDIQNQQMLKNIINNLRNVLEKENIKIESQYGKGYTLKIS